MNDILTMMYNSQTKKLTQKKNSNSTKLIYESLSAFMDGNDSMIHNRAANVVRKNMGGDLTGAGDSFPLLVILDMASRDAM